MGTYKMNEQVYDVERKEPRVKKNFTVNVKLGDRVYSGIAGNISKTGIYLEIIGLTPAKEEEVAISFIGDNSIFDLFGEIRWDMEIIRNGSDEIVSGMGVKLHSVPVEYINFVEYQRLT